MALASRYRPLSQPMPRSKIICYGGPINLHDDQNLNLIWHFNGYCIRYQFTVGSKGLNFCFWLALMFLYHSFVDTFFKTFYLFITLKFISTVHTLSCNFFRGWQFIGSIRSEHCSVVFWTWLFCDLSNQCFNCQVWIDLVTRETPIKL